MLNFAARSTSLFVPCPVPKMVDVGSFQIGDPLPKTLAENTGGLVPIEVLKIVVKNGFGGFWTVQHKVHPRPSVLVVGGMHILNFGHRFQLLDTGGSSHKNSPPQ